MSTSIRITEDIIPKVYKSIKSVFKKLKVENKFDFFVTSDTYQANASCNLMSVSSKPYIILTSKLIELLNSKELEFVIGHEVAHYIYQHALYPNPQTTENRSLKLNILNLSRAAEISADRIGFLACGDLEASLRTNLKLASGLDDKHLNFKFSAYLDQLRELETLGKSNSQLFSTHPSFLIRMQALFWFSMTKEYHEFFETKKEIKLIGKKKIIGKNRAPTISFTIEGMTSKKVSKLLVNEGIATRNDNFYAWRCLEALGIDTNDGVVRISMVHYNSIEDVDSLIKALKKILD